MSNCSVDGCDRPSRSRGHCSAHARRLQRSGRLGGPIGDRNPKPPGPCSLEGCEHPSAALGYCATHYARFRRTGDAGDAEISDRRTRATTDTLMAAGVSATGNACVLGPNGRRPLSPQVKRGDPRTALARLVWEAVHGPIPPGLQVLHWCHNDACVSIRHLYVGTQRDNNADIRAIYEIGRQIVAARVQNGGPGIARGVECDRP